MANSFSRLHAFGERKVFFQKTPYEKRILPGGPKNQGEGESII